MDIVLIIVIVLIVAVWLWLNTLALLCLFLDPDLAPIQRWGQSVFILLVPFLGASFALLLIKSHSPEVVAKFYIPWPLVDLSMINLHAVVVYTIIMKTQAPIMHRLSVKLITVPTVGVSKQAKRICAFWSIGNLIFTIHLSTLTAIPTPYAPLFLAAIHTAFTMSS